MAAPVNPTALTPPRVALIDDRTGAISREWYRFFLSLRTAIDGTVSDTATIVDTSSLSASLDAALFTLQQSLEVTPDMGALSASLDQSNTLLAALALLPDSNTSFTALQSTTRAALQALELQPQYTPHTVTPSASLLYYRTVTATTTASSSDYTILCDATAGAITINLPPASTSAGLVLVAKKIDATANGVTLDGSGGETIDGAATLSWTTQWQSYTVQCNGTGWYIL